MTRILNTIRFGQRSYSPGQEDELLRSGLNSEQFQNLEEQGALEGFSEALEASEKAQKEKKEAKAQKKEEKAPEGDQGKVEALPEDQGEGAEDLTNEPKVEEVEDEEVFNRPAGGKTVDKKNTGKNNK